MAVQPERFRRYLSGRDGLAGAVLSFSLYEGGNDSFPTSDTEAKVFPSGSFSSASDGAQATATPAPLFAESNCYNNLGSPGGTIVSWGDSNGSTRAKICGDNTVPWPGGKWYSKTFESFILRRTERHDLPWAMAQRSKRLRERDDVLQLHLLRERRASTGYLGPSCKQKQRGRLRPSPLFFIRSRFRLRNRRCISTRSG